MSDEKKKKTSIRINTNVSKLASQNLKRTNAMLQQSLMRLSTGLAINPTKTSEVEAPNSAKIAFTAVAYDRLGHIIVDIQTPSGHRGFDATA
jgi:hypothetical protein